ncbi:MAG TPA: trypsin-like peptidase domain-containing protein [Chryseosolibacter sp.]|nr:trypsin-like peptidase domain-containing protein [Chryseosolibacter sp.]
MTNDEKKLLDDLHAYADGSLAEPERLALEEQMRTDHEFRRQAGQYLQLIDTLRKAGERNRLKSFLDLAHTDVAPLAHKRTFTLPGANRNVKLWPAIAAAASVVVVSIVGTFIMTQSVKEKQSQEFRALGRVVEQIRKSQKAIMEDIADVKKTEIPSANYAGTGFLVSSNGFLVTSSHVVRGADSVFVENKKFGRLKAEVVTADVTNDIAVLKIIEPFRAPTLPFTIRKTEADLGEQIFTLGFPREDIVYGEGSISAATGYKQNASSYQVAVPVNPGNSGGPLLNHQGEVVGMISGIQTETIAAAFAVKSPVILDAINLVPLDSIKKAPTLPFQNKMKGLSRVQQIKKMQDYVFVVRVYNQSK